MEELFCGKYRMQIPAAQFSLSTDTMALADFARVKHSARVRSWLRLRSAGALAAGAR